MHRSALSIASARSPARLARRPARLNQTIPDYLVHKCKVALPLFQFGLEPNVYYIPPIHAPDAFLQMFDLVRRALQTYRRSPDDPIWLGC